jgi:hypothetical protein
MDPKPKITPKDFFLWAGAMASFYWSVIAYIFLVFEYINYAFPNPLQYYPSDPYQSGISYQMASLIVMLPLYLLVMQFIRRDIARDPSRADVWVRRWALILTLFVAGATIALDLIILLTTFLSGEALTSAFLLKVLVTFLVAGAVFLHFVSDLRGYWTRYPKRRTAVAAAVALLAVGTIIAGFFIVGTPHEARLSRFDAEKVSDLESINGNILSYWQVKQALPESLTQMYASLPYAMSIPVDPQTGAAYGYQAVGPLSYKLCATFNFEGTGSRYYPIEPMTISARSEKPIPINSWEHEAGDVCFDRTIDPSFYPPIPSR